MKKILLSMVVAGMLMVSATQVSAQRFAYVNTDYIMSKIPEYETAQTEIDRLGAEWKQETDRMQAEIEGMYRGFQDEQFLLTDEQKEQKIKEIEQKEKELQEYQKAKFGYEGELFEKRKELIKPIQDRIYNAIEELANDRGYDFIFDKANSTTILFADAKNDRSDLILKKLGYDN